jgi:hypothetical protein
MGVIEIVFKTRDEAESITLMNNHKITPQRQGEMFIFRINDGQRQYIESEGFANEVKTISEKIAAIDKVRSALAGSAPAAGASKGKAKGERGPRISLTDDMKKVLADCKSNGVGASDARRKLEAVFGKAPSYGTVLNFYKKG